MRRELFTKFKNPNPILSDFKSLDKSNKAKPDLYWEMFFSS